MVVAMYSNLQNEIGFVIGNIQEEICASPRERVNRLLIIIDYFCRYWLERSDVSHSESASLDVQYCIVLYLFENDDKVVVITTNNISIRNSIIFKPEASQQLTKGIGCCYFRNYLRPFFSKACHFLLDLAFTSHFIVRQHMFTSKVRLFSSHDILFMGILINESNVKIFRSCKHQHGLNVANVVRSANALIYTHQVHKFVV